MQTSDEIDMLSFARPIAEAQPFSTLVGARIVDCSEGTAIIELEVEDRHRQQYGLVHGGVFGYLIDMAVSFAAGTVLGPSLVSTGYHVRLLANTRTGVLRATAHVTGSSNEAATVEVAVTVAGTGGADKLCATGSGTACLTGRASGGESSEPHRGERG